MSIMAAGMEWQFRGRKYQERFGVSVPDWVCALPMDCKLPLIRATMRIEMRLADRVLVGNGPDGSEHDCPP